MKNIFLILPFIFSLSVRAEVKTWTNPDCANGSCEIKSIKLYLDKHLSRDLGMQKMVAEFTASSPELVGKYAFVQYIRGCIFDSNAQGPIRYASRTYIGQTGQRFLHPEWQIDNVTLDPIYFSTRNPGYDPIRGFEIPRNANYMVVDPKDGDEVRWGGKLSNIVDNRLFVFDQPSPGSLGNMNGKPKATNTSLEFKTCLYAISDIPKKVENPSVEYPNPVACLEWNSRFHYNFSTRRFAESSTIHPYCRP